MFCALDILVDRFVEDACRSPLFLHQIVLLSIDQAKLKSDQALAHVLAVRSDAPSYQHIIERIPGEEAANQSLRFDRDGDKVAALTLDEGLRIVVVLATNRTETFVDAFIALESFKTGQASAMIHMAAAQDGLVLEL